MRTLKEILKEIPTRNLRMAYLIGYIKGCTSSENAGKNIAEIIKIYEEVEVEVEGED